MPILCGTEGWVNGRRAAAMPVDPRSRADPASFAPWSGSPPPRWMGEVVWRGVFNREAHSPVQAAGTEPACRRP